MINAYINGILTLTCMTGNCIMRNYKIIINYINLISKQYVKWAFVQNDISYSPITHWLRIISSILFEYIKT